MPAIFAPVKDEQLQKDFKEANDGAIKAMQEMDAWLKTQEATANDNFALGAEKVSAKMLMATERVDVPLDKLAEVGRKDLDRNLAALKEACATLRPGVPITECVAKAQAHKPTGGSGGDGSANNSAISSRFILEKRRW